MIENSTLKSMNNTRALHLDSAFHAMDDGHGVNGYHDSHYSDYVIHGQAEHGQAIQVGFELECEQVRPNDECMTRDEVAGSLRGAFGDKLAGIEEDGSLDRRHGMEVVSSPMTLNYAMNKFGLADLCGLLDEAGFDSHDRPKCGLHVHVGREQLGQRDDTRDLAICKIMYIVDRFMSADGVSGALDKFSRRNGAYGYCKKPCAGITDTDKRPQFLSKTKAKAECGDRYLALNLRNRNTIEFRLFKGTTNARTLAATLQLVDCICRYAMTHTLPEVQSCKFGDIVRMSKYAEIYSYCARRGISLDD